MQNKFRILLLDGHTVQAFSVAKSLRKANMHVTLFYEKKVSYGHASRYPNKKLKCPSVKDHPDTYINFLINYLKINNIDLIIPLFDNSADLLNIHREEIEKFGTKIGLPGKNQYDLARNKGLLMEFCRKNNISHPLTVRINKNNYENVAKLVGFPSLLKPDNSSGAVGIIHLNSVSQLSKYFSNHKSEFQSLSLQAFVNHEGFYYNSMLYRSKAGDFSKVVIIKILRYFPIKGGTGSYNETVDFANIEKISKDILNRLKWVGFADIDFIVDKNSSEPKLIEINPRIPACIHSAYVSGINFPEIIVLDTLENEIPGQKYFPCKKIRYFAMDVLWFIFSKDKFKAKPSWFKFFGKNLHYQDGCIKDPFTMIAGIFMGLGKYLNPNFRKTKINKGC